LGTLRRKLKTANGGALAAWYQYVARRLRLPGHIPEGARRDPRAGRLPE